MQTRFSWCLTMIVVAIPFAFPATAQIEKIEIREDKSPPPEIIVEIDPDSLGVRVFNFYAICLGPGDATPANRVNSVQSVGDATDGAQVAIRKEAVLGDGQFVANRRAYFHQHSPPFGSDWPPHVAAISIFPAIAFDSFAGLKVKSDDGSSTLIGNLVWLDRDGDGRQDILANGSEWANTQPENGQSFPTLNPDTDVYEIFLLQLCVVGLDANAPLGDTESPSIIRSNVFAGNLRLWRLGGAAEPALVPFEVDILPLSDPCPVDLNGDGSVGSADLAVLLGSWGNALSQADLDGSGEVGASDLAILLGSWGPCP